MNTIADTQWTFRIITNDPIRRGPCFTLLTDVFQVEVYKRRDDTYDQANALYHIAIARRDDPRKKVYESRFDSFYVPTSNPNTAKNAAILKLSRFSL